MAQHRNAILDPLSVGGNLSSRGLEDDTPSPLGGYEVPSESMDDDTHLPARGVSSKGLQDDTPPPRGAGDHQEAWTMIPTWGYPPEPTPPRQGGLRRPGGRYAQTHPALEDCTPSLETPPPSSWALRMIRGKSPHLPPSLSLCTNPSSTHQNCPRHMPPPPPPKASIEAVKANANVQKWLATRGAQAF